MPVDEDAYHRSDDRGLRSTTTGSLRIMLPQVQVPIERIDRLGEHVCIRSVPVNGDLLGQSLQ